MCRGNIAPCPWCGEDDFWASFGETIICDCGARFVWTMQYTGWWHPNATLTITDTTESTRSIVWKTSL